MTTTSVKRPILLQVESSLQRDRVRGSLKRNKTVGELNGLETGFCPRSNPRPGERTSFDSAEVGAFTPGIVTSSQQASIPTNSRSSLPSNYGDLHYADSSCYTGSRKPSFGSATTSTNSSASSSRSSNTNSIESIDSPSLILPHLYLGDQDQTQMDTLSSLNISYVLSLQSLPKFLDKTQPQQQQSSEPPTPASTPSNAPNTQHTDTVNVPEIPNADQQSKLLPSVNSSKDYLVKIDPRSDSSCEPIVSELPLNANIDIDELEPTGVQHGDDDEEENDDNDGKANSESSSNLEPSTSVTNCQVTLLGRRLKKRCDKLSSSVHKLIRGKCINISDTFEQIVDKFFDETHSFIEEARRNRCNVLVHCKAGISRSPTIAIAYLMKWKRLHLQDAYNFVKQCRPQISPNLNFMGQLVLYERQLQMCAKSQMIKPTCCLITRPMELPIHYEQQQQQQQEQKILGTSTPECDEIVRTL